MKRLCDELSVLPGIGPKSAEKFLKINIQNINDLLAYYPFRFVYSLFVDIIET
ncbi:hypothetical protein HO411_10945 [Streptococcus suis]|nr:hypothetical protein [Streptococcus suis]